jgi:hypothetical protein
MANAVTAWSKDPDSNEYRFLHLTHRHLLQDCLLSFLGELNVINYEKFFEDIFLISVKARK